MSEEIKTAWGKVMLLAAKAQANGKMPTDLKDLGFIYEDDGVSIETEDGTVLELKGTGGELLDQLKQEDKLTLNLTLIGVNKDNVERFWDFEEDDNGIIWIKSTVTSEKFAIEFTSKVIGSKTLLAPKVSVKASLTYGEKGWMMTCAFTLMKASNGKLFGFGEVGKIETEPDGDDGDDGDDDDFS